MKRLLTLAATALILVSGCTDPERDIDVTLVTSPPSPMTVQRSGIELVEGLAVGFRVTPLEDGQPVEARLDLQPDQNAIVGIDQALEDDEWIIYGVKPGTTTVSVRFNGLLAFEIPATVRPQHTSESD